jgi:hypothetical protein
MKIERNKRTRLVVFLDLDRPRKSALFISLFFERQFGQVS